MLLNGCKGTGSIDPDTDGSTLLIRMRHGFCGFGSLPRSGIRQNSLREIFHRLRRMVDEGLLANSASAPVKAIEQSGESPDQSIRYRSVAKGNCVFNRKGGEQLAANEQSVTKVNSIRPSLSGSVLVKREPLTTQPVPDETQLRVAE